MREEIDRVVGSKTLLSYDDLTELKYTGAAFKETLRLYPPVTDISRKTNKEIIAQNLVIPKDTTVNV